MRPPRTWRHPALLALATVLTSQSVPAAGLGTLAAEAALAPSLVSLRSVDVMGDGSTVPGWGADTGYDRGDRSVVDGITTSGVRNAAPAGVYSTVRYGKSFTYTVRDLRPGQAYTLRLHMAEDFYGAKGQRLIDVAVNGRTVVTGLDLFATAGAYKAVVRDVTGVADARGRMTLTMTGAKGDAVLSGFQVLRTGAANAPAAPAALHAKALAARTVHLDWKPDVEASRYTVYRNGHRLATTTDAAFLDLTAAPGKSYSYSVAATGPSYRTSATTRPVKVSTPANDAPTATGRFTTRGGVVVDPAGKVFTPVGANIGSWSTASGRGVANGNSKAAQDWGWNAVRITFYFSTEYSWTYRSQWGKAELLRQLQEVVDEYRARGIVVVVDGHDNPWTSPDTAKTLAEMEEVWKDVATRYKGDSGVWFNLVNEPEAADADWYEVQSRMLSAVRSTGAQNVAVVDAPQWGQDLGSTGPWFVGNKHGYDATMAPRLAAHYGNVVLSQHNYGAFAKYTTPAAYGKYADTVKRRGLPLVTGEAGYTIDKSSTAGGFQPNYDGALSAFAANPGRNVGTFVWAATHNDNYSLKNDGGPFYGGGAAGANLSDMGRRLWALTH